MLQLSNDDFLGFSIQNPGIVVIYFKQQQCGGCIKFDPVFLQLERKKNQYGLQNVQFATVNITSNPQILRKAKDVDVVIDRTPLIIIFYQTRPYAKYHGPLDEENVFTFIKQVLSNEITSIQNPPPLPPLPPPPVAAAPSWRTVPPEIPAPSHLMKTSYMGGLRKGTGGGNANKEQLYAEDLTEGLFDNWKFLTPKNKPWLTDINQVI
jgi:thiol-disulfide isomerase/thioredoxin